MMTNRPDLGPLLLLLLTMSSLVSSQHLLSHDGGHAPNSSSTQEHDVVTTPGTAPNNSSPKGPDALNVTQNAEVTEGKFSTGVVRAHQAQEFTANQDSKGNGPSRGTESDNAHRSAGTESPQHNPASNSSSGPTSLPGTSAHFVSAEPSKMATNSVIAQTVTTNGPTMLSNVTQPAIHHATEKRTYTTKTRSPTMVQSTQTTATTRGVKKSHVCPTEAPKKEGLVSRCLVAIALLTALATIFIMSTVVLATKLAAVRYRRKEGLLHETEMICISALMNDTEHPVPKPRHPKSNGALIPNVNEEDGDDLTLNSFLPDTDYVV